MPFTHSFTDVTPFARYDGLPWTRIRVEESATGTGAWSQIADMAIAVDPTPDTPNPVDVTVTTSTLETGYFRFRFSDAASTLSPYTEAVYSPSLSSGAPYFTVAEFRARFPDLTSAAYPDTKVEEVRALAEQALEDEMGVSFVARSETETLSGDGTGSLRLGRGHVRDVTAASIGGTALTAAELLLVLKEGRYLDYTNGWTAGTGNVVVTYTHGYDRPPLRVKQAAMVLTRDWLVQGPVSERALRIAVESGESLPTSGPPFFIPEVNEVVRAYSERVYVG